MNTPLRRGLPGLIGALLVLLVSGCMKVDVDLTLNPDDTVDGVMIMAFDDDVATLLGTDPEALWEEAGSDLESGLPPGSTQEPWAQDGYTGTRVTFTAVPLDQMSQANDADTLRIVREGDEFVVTGAMDLSDMGAEGSGEMMAGFDVRIAVTFPGAVSEHNGTLQGRTVVWEPQPGERTEMMARGDASGGSFGVLGGADGSGWLPVILGGVAALIVAVVLFVVLRNRRERAADAHLRFAQQRWEEQYPQGVPALFPPTTPPATPPAGQPWGQPVGPGGPVAAAGPVPPPPPAAPPAPPPAPPAPPAAPPAPPSGG